MFVEQWKASFRDPSPVPCARCLPERLLGVAAARAFTARRRQRPAAAARSSRFTRVSRATYGAPRIHAELAAQGVRCSRKRVARLMRVAGVAGCHRRRFHTTRRDPARRARLTWCNARLSPPRHQVWVADMTYVPTEQGFLFLAVVLDACSRRVVGWSMAAHLRTELPLAALEMALQHRRPQLA